MEKEQKSLNIGIKKAYSYRIFSLSVFFTFVGFLLNTLFIKYSVEGFLLLFNSFQGKILVLLYLIGSVALSLIVYLMLKKDKIYDCTYFIGFLISFVSILLSILIFKDATFLLSGILLGYSFMLAVIKGYVKKFKLMEETLGNNYQKGISKGVLIKFLIASLVALIIVVIGVILYQFVWDGIINYLLFISPIFMLLGQIFVSKQTLDDIEYLRLETYYKNKDNENLRKRVEEKIVEKRRRRTFLLTLKKIFRFFLGYKIEGKENIKDDLPAIFVSNHGEYYGPIAAVANMPYLYRPWIESQLLEPEKGYPYTYKYTFSLITWLPVCIRKLLAKIAVQISSKTFSAFDPIPVYRSELRSIFKTFNLSVESLKQGDSILLFPESTHNTEDGKYAKGGKVGDFFTGFAHIGVKYYEETGKVIKFYPIYLHKKKRRFIIGEGLEFNPNNDRAIEKKRLAEELKKTMENLRDFAS